MQQIGPPGASAGQQPANRPSQGASSAARPSTGQQPAARPSTGQQPSSRPSADRRSTSKVTAGHDTITIKQKCFSLQINEFFPRRSTGCSGLQEAVAEVVEGGSLLHLRARHI